MGERRNIAEIKVKDFGMEKRFRLKDYNRSTLAGYTVTITIWHLVDDVITKIVDNVACTSATYVGTDTFVIYKPLDATVFTAFGDYDAEIRFVKLVDDYDEDCKTFAWRVIPSSKD